jgi:GNAT superfamily N-acetyltransferase
MIAIRMATPADAPALAALRWKFRGDRQRVIESAEDFTARCRTWMQSRLGAGSCWRTWIAEEDGRVVGQVWLQIFEKLPNPNGEGQRHAYLSNLYVEPASRGGVGTRLLEAAIDYAKAEGADRLVLWPSARSVTLYRRRGFISDGGLLELKL